VDPVAASCQNQLWTPCDSETSYLTYLEFVPLRARAARRRSEPGRNGPRGSLSSGPSRWTLDLSFLTSSMAQLPLCIAVLFFSMVSGAPRPPPKCAGQVCESKKHPVLKYNGTCFCESHPCPAHSCETVKGFPVLAYDYNSKGSIVRLEIMLNAVVTSHDLVCLHRRVGLLLQKELSRRFMWRRANSTAVFSGRPPLPKFRVSYPDLPQWFVPS
jgi:hypothetical protein